MKQLYMKQKVLSLWEKFTVKDAAGNDVYFIEGSFMKIPKTFSIRDAQGKEVAVITKKTFSFLPTFFVELDGKQTITIKKDLTFLRSRYSIDAASLKVQGNWWDMDFVIMKSGNVVGEVSKKWFTWGDSYEVTIYEEELETVIISLVVAIDRVKADEAAASS